MPGIRHTEYVIIGAILVASPSLFQAFAGGIGIATLLIRFALALAVVWACAAVIERVTDTYSREARRHEIEARLSALETARQEAVARLRQGMEGNQQEAAPSQGSRL